MTQISTPLDGRELLRAMLNDVRDVSADRLHPDKRLRPLAAGRISVRMAVVGGIACAAVELVCLGSSTASHRDMSFTYVGWGRTTAVSRCG